MKRQVSRSSGANIVYRLRPDATAQAESGALASVYRYILDCANKKAAELTPESDGRDGTKVQGDSADGQIIPD